MDLRHSLQTLGIDDPAEITLNELVDRIQDVHPDQLSKQDILQVFMRWLHERIKKDIQQKSLLSEFVNLLLTGGKLQQEPFSEDEIKEALKEWQIKDTVETPANIRRYQMVQLDFHELFEQVRRGTKQKRDSPVRSTSNQDEHSLAYLNKLINSQDKAKIETTESTALWVPGQGKQQTGANKIPLGRKADLQGNIYDEIVKIKRENNRKSSTKAIKASPAEQTAKLSSRDVASTEASPIKSYEPDYSPLNMPPYLTTSPWHGYICKRCDQPGHWIQLCPTKLDPRWDKPPPHDYQCGICKAFGKHFATLCPQNEYELSLTQQRLRIKDQPKTPTREHTHYRDRSPFMPSPRGRSGSPVYNSRRKNHGTYRQDKSPKDRSYNSGGRYQSHDDRRSVSPWTARKRMTRGLYHLRRRSTTPPREHRKRAKAPPLEERRPVLYLYNNKKKADEGRLGYYDEEFIGSHISPATPKETSLPENRLLDTVESKNELMADTASAPEGTAEEIERTRKEADKFLDALAVEILLGKTQASLLTNDMPSNDSTYQVDEMNIDESEEENGGLSKDKLAPTKIADQHLQRLPLRPKATPFSSSRTIPIIHNKANREPAEELIEEA
ncbi:hypothetical protein F5Y00DRAFT_263481 [Daldinia vernicosa]|uniref:uncharacterized protein n=1 Tax=Daldinia vernicosa TaxID=114800 RepID=UPI00200848C9|nr:uncharacterized protein F5Y00DRAFT_263481 [Daldinia vernicosa]KAI0847571.1 hypothetical protein F5Y00DRAFT_263481 [Daldinia vernicosa]